MVRTHFDPLRVNLLYKIQQELETDKLIYGVWGDP